MITYKILLLISNWGVKPALDRPLYMVSLKSFTMLDAIVALQAFDFYFITIKI
jgi:hypothetical protein